MTDTIEGADFRPDSTHVHSTRERPITVDFLEAQRQEYLEAHPLTFPVFDSTVPKGAPASTEKLRDLIGTKRI